MGGSSDAKQHLATSLVIASSNMSTSSDGETGEFDCRDFGSRDRSVRALSLEAFATAWKIILKAGVDASDTVSSKPQDQPLQHEERPAGVVAADGITETQPTPQNDFDSYALCNLL